MSKKSKIDAIINIVANKEPACCVFEFVELGDKSIEIRRETVKIPTIGESTKLTIGIGTKGYENTKKNIIGLVEKLSKE